MVRIKKVFYLLADVKKLTKYIWKQQRHFHHCVPHYLVSVFVIASSFFS